MSELITRVKEGFKPARLYNFKIKVKRNTDPIPNERLRLIDCVSSIEFDYNIRKVVKDALKIAKKREDNYVFIESSITDVTHPTPDPDPLESQRENFSIFNIKYYLK